LKGADEMEHPELERGILAQVRRRFTRAALSASDRLRVYYLDDPTNDRAVGYGLAWVGRPPRRDLCVRWRAASDAVRWELASAELGLSRTGRVRGDEFSPEFQDKLVEAVLDQKTWQRSIVPRVDITAPRSSWAGDPASSAVQEPMREKAEEIRDRLHDVADSFRQNVADGFQSAVKRNPQEDSKPRRQLGRAPTGLPPSHKSKRGD
jgi:hypothetical protein